MAGKNSLVPFSLPPLSSLIQEFIQLPEQGHDS